MKVFKGKVFKVVDYVLGSGEEYGSAVLFVYDKGEQKNIPFKVVIKPNKGGAWTYSKDYIYIEEMNENGYLLTLHRDESTREYEEDGEIKVEVYEARDYDFYIVDLEKVTITK